MPARTFWTLKEMLGEKLINVELRLTPSLHSYVDTAAEP